MAGGMSQDADKIKVSQTLNLAAKLSDGAKLYIPSVGEQMMTSQESNNSMSVLSSSNTNGININQASASELEALPGIGKVAADKIIKNRPYQNISELVEKKVIGGSVFEKIKTKISIY
jgi:competence protein ComEA